MKAAVLGSPIAHSLSPFLHRAAYAALGFDDWSYSLVECSSDGLAAFMAGLDDGWAGLSLTMPLKRTVLPLLQHVDPVAAGCGGANTVVFRADGRYGYNTDVQGIVDALAEAGAPVPGSVTILGGGATACSALAAVRELGAGGATVVVRDPARAGDLLSAAARLDMRVRFRDFSELADGPSDLLISTVPAGAADTYAAWIRSAGAAPAAVMDVVYHPWPTPLALAAASAGSVVASGFAMLLHQAAAQVELMTGKPAPVEAMRAAGEAELARREATGGSSLRACRYGRRSFARSTRAAPRASPRSRRPATTPGMSALGRFWLSFALASTRVISSSTPTTARSRPSMKERGASSTDHGRGLPASCLSVRRRTTDSVHPASSWMTSSPCTWAVT
jgi:shikimate dehydrogenase